MLTTLADAIRLTLAWPDGKISLLAPFLEVQKKTRARLHGLAPRHRWDQFRADSVHQGQRRATSADGPGSTRLSPEAWGKGNRIMGRRGEGRESGAVDLGTVPCRPPHPYLHPHPPQGAGTLCESRLLPGLRCLGSLEFSLPDLLHPCQGANSRVPGPRCQQLCQHCRD